MNCDICKENNKLRIVLHNKLDNSCLEENIKKNIILSQVILLKSGEEYEHAIKHYECFFEKFDSYREHHCELFGNYCFYSNDILVMNIVISKNNNNFKILNPSEFFKIIVIIRKIRNRYNIRTIL